MLALDADVVVPIDFTELDLGDGVSLTHLVVVQVEELIAELALAEIFKDGAIGIQESLARTQQNVLRVHLLPGQVSNHDLNQAWPCETVRLKKWVSVQHIAGLTLSASQISIRSALISCGIVDAPLLAGMQHLVVITDQTLLLGVNFASRDIDVHGLALTLLVNEEVLLAENTLSEADLEVTIGNDGSLIQSDALLGGLIQIEIPIAPQTSAIVGHQIAFLRAS